MTFDQMFLSFFQYHLQINKEQFLITCVSSDFFLSLLIRFTMNKGTINLYRDNKGNFHCYELLKLLRSQ